MNLIFIFISFWIERTPMEKPAKVTTKTRRTSATRTMRPCTLQQLKKVPLPKSFWPTPSLAAPSRQHPSVSSPTAMRMTFIWVRTFLEVFTTPQITRTTNMYESRQINFAKKLYIKTTFEFFARTTCLFLHSATGVKILASSILNIKWPTVCLMAIQIAPNNSRPSHPWHRAPPTLCYRSIWQITRRPSNRVFRCPQRSICSSSSSSNRNSSYHSHLTTDSRHRPTSNHLRVCQVTTHNIGQICRWKWSH